MNLMGEILGVPVAVNVSLSDENTSETLSTIGKTPFNSRKYVCIYTLAR